MTDPQFSKRASPVQFAGPERFTPSPCTVDQLPPLHAAFISHNHYDHLDYGSVQAILAKETADLAKAKEGKGHGLPGQQPFTGTTWFVPLRVSANLISMGVRKERIVELDWWQSGQLLGTDPSISPTITAVPAQHQSARYPWDRNATLWCGFVVETPMPGAAAPVRWYFSGDTGYRSVPPGALPGSAEERSVPTCPAFREIGEKYGAIDLALLPIGAYSPRHFMSSFHASPEDAVDMHVDVRAARSIGMHWGTFLMTDEPIEEPPARLASAAKAKGLAQDAFVAIKHGQVYSPTAPGGIVRDA